MLRAESIFLNETQWLVNAIRTEMGQAEDDLERVKARSFSFSPGWNSHMERPDSQMNRNERAAILIPALAATGLGLGAGHILGNSIRQVGCGVLSIFNMCSDRKTQKDIDGLAWKMNYMGQNIQKLMASTSEMAFLLGGEFRKTQEAVNAVQTLVDKNFREVERVVGVIRDEQIKLGIEMICQRKYGEYLADFNQWQSSVSNFTNYLLLLHTDIKSYRVGVLAYEASIYSALNTLSKGFLSPSLITPDQLHEVLLEVARKEVMKKYTL